ncbi:MAG TPA: Rrf2 family transcriptional regulator [Desulfitobacterium dehalogenans]|uniref:Rrf2 family transcriptional regulator n=1 Tax=Desulfitobacterium dehalogenans TaxID=36854 RepID=A0A7C6Z4V2_9FIRM|nr:Rrf2 family transcriptional regulator [Desulfitobacterium dehalogenans]
MQLSSRFPVAVQIIIIIAWCPEDVKVTSEVLAVSVNTNPALIRRIMRYLKKAELISIPSGTGGAKLTRNTEMITLLDIYRAVELTDQNALFGLHDHPNLYCPIGSRINEVLRPPFEEAKKALEESLGKVTIERLLESFPPFDYSILKHLKLN